MKTRIILTGTGAGEPPYVGTNGIIYDRHHPSALFIIEKGNEKFYFCIDFTLYLCDALIKLKTPSSKINVILLSHGHEDHVNFFRFISAKLEHSGIKLKYDPEFSKKLMRLYAPKPVIRALAEMLSRKKIYPIRSTDSRYPKEEIYYEYPKQGRMKPVLTFKGVPSGTKIKLPLDIEVLCVGVKHKYSSVISMLGSGETAFGYLVSVKNGQSRFNALYLTDYECMNLAEKERFKKNITGYPLDLCILGMPIPFPEEEEKERGRQRHMGIEDTLSFFKELREEGYIKLKAAIGFTHLSDRVGDTKTGDVVLMGSMRKIIKKYWDPELLWIPKKDGFQIIYNQNRLTKKGLTI